MLRPYCPSCRTKKSCATRATSSFPMWASRDSRSSRRRACCWSGPAGSGRPRRSTSPRLGSARSGWWTSTWSTRPTCSPTPCTAHPPPPGLVPSCAEGGVLGVLPGIIGSIQAMETIKLILGAGQPLIGRLVLFDALKLQFRELKLEKDPECPVCGAHPTVTELIDYQAFCGIGAEPSYDGAEITAHELRDEWQRNPALVVVDVREPHEYEIAHIDGAVLMPLGELPDRLGELDGHHEIVTHCHHGARWLKALEILRAAGFSKVRSLRGGIDAWAVNVDPALPRY